MSDIDDEIENDSETDDASPDVSSDVANGPESPNDAIANSSAAAPPPINPLVAAYLQSKQDMAGAQQKVNQNQLIAGLGRSMSTLAQSAYGNRAPIDTSAFNSLDQAAEAPVQQMAAQQKAGAQAVADQANLSTAEKTVGDNDPGSPQSKAAQAMVQRLYPGKFDPSILSVIPASEIQDLIYKPSELDEKYQAYKETHTDALLAHQDAVDKKNSDADEKTQASISKDLNSLTTSGRNALGTAAKAQVAVQRLKDIVSNPSSTNQDLNSAYSDLNAIVSGASTVSGSDHQSYTTLGTMLAGAAQFIGGVPTAPIANDIKAHVADVATRMGSISQGVIDKNTAQIQAGRSGWISRHPDDWGRMVQAATQAPTPSYSSQTSQTTPQYPSDVMSYAQKNGITPDAAQAIKSKRLQTMSGGD